jgi:lipopolysaccharide assembly protein A
MTSPGNSGDQPTAASGAGAGAGGATDEQHVAGRTRMGLAWAAAALSAVVLLLLLIFILENGQQVDIAYFGAHGHLPLGVALLLAAVLGILLVVIPGAGRIIQLRRTARRHRRAHASTAPPGAAQPPGQATRT